MATLRLPAYNWAPRDYQLPVWNEAMKPSFRRAVLAWARRLGKDEVAMHITAVKAMQRIGVYYHCLPEYEQARKAIWDMRNPKTGRRRWQDIFPPEMIKKVNEQKMQIEFVNNSLWQLVGSDNIDSLMGGSPVGIVMSEAALSNPTAFAFFKPILVENRGWSIHVSSVRGKNHFYNEYQDAVADPNSYASHLSAYDTSVYSVEDLEAARKWYRSQHGAVLGESLFAQELESQWEAAVVGAVWPAELMECEKTRAYPIKHDPRYPVHTSWDIGSADGTVVLMWQVIDRTPRLIDWFAVKDRGLASCADELRTRPYRYGVHVGPHDVRSKTWELDGISRHAEALKFGINFTVIGRPQKKSDGVAASAQLIKMMEVNVQEEAVENATDDCRFILDTLKQYRYAFDPTKNILSQQPVHDWTSHYADALQTFAIYLATNGSDMLKGRMKLQGNSEADIDAQEEMRYRNMRLSEVLNARRGSSRALGGWNGGR